MKTIKKIFIVLAILFFAFSFVTQPVLADNSTSQSVQQEIQSLLQQIFALMQQILKLRTQINSQPSVHLPSTNAPQGAATLTVNASGVTAYVSINNGAQFAYTSPITLNNGDSYSVTASLSAGGSNSTSKCSGVASAGGSYVCNVTIN